MSNGTDNASFEQKLKTYRLNRTEFSKITELLGHAPEGLEWALFSALWSEHCSYKSSKVHLRKLFNKSERVVVASGENAGIIDLGEGEKIAFKMESHNHPSFIEPYEGAATGVGGILRDIFTMGARPVMLANYLCFGEPHQPRMVSLVDGVVRGIGGYGNCVGVPTVTGQTEFHSSYNNNILVNALAVGLFRKGDPIVTAKAQGVGNSIVYVGAKTGRDGVHGASMASESFDDNNEKKRPTIQKGDPFYEKLLIESCLEVMKLNLAVAVQDMGAAGLTSSSFEMAARGEVGLDLHLDKVPLRDPSMLPEEILLSESQERMLMVVKPENVAAVQKVFSKWDLDAEVIGTVTTGPQIKLFWHGELACAIDPKILVDNAPVYERPFTDWKSTTHVEDSQAVQSSLKSVSRKKDARDFLMKILSDVRGCSRDWIFNQYDQRVGARTVADCGESVSAIKLPDSERLLALVVGGRPHWMRTDAQVGGADSVAFSSIELAAKGFLPLAATDCLNYGNPENSSIMTEFVASVEAMSQQCEILNTPIISGNVSFYNETLSKNITSTPATGIVGLRDLGGVVPKSHFVGENNKVYKLKMPMIEGSGMAAEVLGTPMSWTGKWNGELVKQFCDTIRQLAMHPSVLSSRVVGKFGLGYAVTRLCLSSENPIGFQGNVADLFSETLYEVLFEVSAHDEKSFHKFQEAMVYGTPFKVEVIGMTGGNKIVFENEFELSLQEAKNSYQSGWGGQLVGIS
jgi:phosphoribosylformylglycinamidine synthase II